MLAYAKTAGLNAVAVTWTGASRNHLNGLRTFASIHVNVCSSLLSKNGKGKHRRLSSTSPHACTSSRQHRARLTPIVASSKVEFLVSDCQLSFGEGLKVVGSDNGIGAWNAASGLALEWGEGNNWTASTQLTEGSTIEFKLVKTNADGETWEDGPNREVTVPEGGGKVVCEWNVPAGTSVGAPKAPKQPAAFSSSPSSSSKPKSKSKAPVVTEKKKAPPAPIAQKDSTPPPPPPAAEPVAEPIAAEPVDDTPKSDGASSLHPELAKLASAVTHGSDGTLSITFGDAADSVDAATLAAKLK